MQSIGTPQTDLYSWVIRLLMSSSQSSITAVSYLKSDKGNHYRYSECGAKEPATGNKLWSVIKAVLAVVRETNFFASVKVTITEWIHKSVYISAETIYRYTVILVPQYTAIQLVSHIALLCMHRITTRASLQVDFYVPSLFECVYCVLIGTEFGAEFTPQSLQ